jgi:hypothetical protein
MGKMVQAEALHCLTDPLTAGEFTSPKELPVELRLTAKPLKVVHGRVP